MSLPRLRSMLRAVWARDRFESGMTDELRFHRDAYIEDLVRSGMTRQEAHRRAAIECGGTAGLKEDLRAARGLRLVDELQQDVRYSIRQLRRGRGVAVMMVLALGVGANLAVFSVVYTALLRPLPHPNPDRLVSISSRDLTDGRDHLTSPLDFFDFERRSISFERLGAYYPPGFTLTGSGPAERVPGARASSGIFDTFGVRPVLGRGFRPEEDRPGTPPVAVISYQLWIRRYGQATSVVGQTILLSGNPYTVVGVLPEGFHSPAMWPRMPDVWVPIGLDPNVGRRDARMLRILGRLRSDVTVEGARAEFEVISKALSAEYAETNSTTGTTIVPLLEQLTREVRPSLLILAAAVGALLLVACGNAAGLLIGRTLERRHEFATRLALGAGRFRLARQVVAENLVIGLLSAVGGFWLASLASTVLVAAAEAAGVPRATEISIDTKTLLAGLVLSLGCTTACALAAALELTRVRVDAPDALTARTVTARRHRSRALLIAAEVALSLALLTGAALLGRSFYALESTYPGFEARNVVTTRLSPPAARYPAGPMLAGFYDRVLDRVRALPGVEVASVVDWLPLSGFGASIGFRVPERSDAAQSARSLAELRVVDRDYFTTLRIPLLAGRGFESRDRDGALRVVIVNESFARAQFGGANAVGRHLLLDRDGWLAVEVIGVVGDIREFSLRVAPGPGVYAPKTQSPWLAHETRDMIVRASSDLRLIEPAIAAIVRELEPDLPLGPVQPMEEVIATSLVRPRFYAWAVALFAMTAILLGGFGIYGVVTSAVIQRTRELGVRLAFGAPQADILARSARFGLIPALSGVLAGLPLAFGAGHVVRQQLFGIEATDLITLVVVVASMTAVALVAALLPAVRATRVDPVSVLRSQ
jgi:putative ABC transport system permease protein